MRTNKKFEDVLPLLSSSLQDKLKHSVFLLQKAERLAKLYSEEGFYLAFSGGKDSQALYHVAELSGVTFKARYSVTTCDPPELIRFIKANYPEVSFTKPTSSIYNMCSHKHGGLLPTPIVRWCCREYKETQGGDMVTLTGVRKAESFNRSKRNEVELAGKKFSGDIQEFEKYRQYQFDHRKKSDTDDYLKFRCVKGKDGLMVMPIIDWLEEEVWEFLNTLGVPHCKLYDEGQTRIGCVLCPMSTLKEKVRDIQKYPHHKHKWIKVILEKYERRPEDVDKYLPQPYEEFDADWPKETVESFGGKYPKRWIESAEAHFDYWVKRDGYDVWFAKTYKQQKMF